MQITKIVGMWLSDYRQEHNLTLEQIADASQRFASGWTAAKVSQIERGQSKADSLANLILLISALNYLTEDKLTIVDIFKWWNSHSNGLIQLANTDSNVVSTASEVIEFLKGQRYRVNLFEINDTQEEGKPLYSLITLASSAERRMASRLNISAEEVVNICIDCYGCRLDDEITIRAGKDATPRKKGLVAHAIMQEIQDYIEGGERG